MIFNTEISENKAKCLATDSCENQCQTCFNDISNCLICSDIRINLPICDCPS